MRSALLLAAAFPRHWYADGGRANLCVVTLWLAQLVVVKVLCLVVMVMVVHGCLVVVGVIGRVVIVAIQDVFTRLADAKIAWLREELARDNRGALGVEDLPARAAMMLSAKSGECIAAVEAVFCVLVPHPKLAVEYLPPHLSEGAAWQTVDCRACMCLALYLLDGGYCRRTHG